MTESILMWIIDQFGGLENLILSGVALVAAKFLVPWLKKGTRMRYATHLTHLADEITDDLLARYPDKDWSRILEESVETIRKELGVTDLSEKRLNFTSKKKREHKTKVATRIASAALSRKRLSSEEKKALAKVLNERK